jgi:hypothetical protein
MRAGRRQQEGHRRAVLVLPVERAGLASAHIRP